MLAQVRSACNFFLNSPKREALLIAIITKGVIDTSRRKPLLDLCCTRWAERHDGYRHFYQAYVFIVKALELIGYGMHCEEFETFATGWNNKAKSDAISLLGSICNFEFIVSFLTAYQFLSHLSGITVKLQSGTAGIMDAFLSIEEIMSVYVELRTNANTHFNKIFLQAKRMGEAVQVEPSKCRVSGYQKHRPNDPTETVEDHYPVNVAVPCLDHISVQLDQRFSSLSNTATSLLGLIPSIIIDREPDLQAAIELYSRDLPSPELIP